MSRKFIIKVNGKDYDVEVTEVSEGGQIKEAKPVAAIEPAKPAPIPVKAPEAVKKPEAISEAAPAAAGSIKVTAPLPGTIIKIGVEAGQKVKRGEVLLILEAMKMENEIVAPNDGEVASIHVAEGGRVNGGDLMVSLK